MPILRATIYLLLFADEGQEVDVVILVSPVGQDARMTRPHSAGIAIIGLCLVSVFGAALAAVVRSS